MTSWRDLLPAPLAAPETPELRRARYRSLAGCVLAAVMFWFFGAMRDALGVAALALVVAVTTYACIQLLLWVRAKNAADDAWLFRERDDAA